MSSRAETGIVATRRRAILDFVVEHGSAQAEELVRHFSISRMTVHRDLEALASDNLVRRVHGGVTTLSDPRVEASVLHRARRGTGAKRAIAAAAARLIAPGEIVVLDDSTTVSLLCDHLGRLGDLTVITNSLGISGRLSGMKPVTLIGLGGQYEPRFDAFFGTQCEQAIAMLRANTLFMSASAIHGSTAFHQEQGVIRAKLAMMEIVERRVLLADSSKFDQSALNLLAPLSAFDVVISDDALPQPIRHRLLDAGIVLRIAPSPASPDGFPSPVSAPHAPEGHS